MNAAIKALRNSVVSTAIALVALWLLSIPASAQTWVYIDGLGMRWWIGSPTAPYLKIVGLKAELDNIRRGIREYRVTLDIKNIGEKPVKGSVSGVHIVGKLKNPNPEGPFDPNDPRNPWIEEATQAFTRKVMSLKPGETARLTGRVRIRNDNKSSHIHLLTLRMQKEPKERSITP